MKFIFMYISIYIYLYTYMLISSNGHFLHIYKASPWLIRSSPPQKQTSPRTCHLFCWPTKNRWQKTELFFPGRIETGQCRQHVTRHPDSVGFVVFSARKHGRQKFTFQPRSRRHFFLTRASREMMVVISLCFISCFSRFRFGQLGWNPWLH